jgi:DnaD/phage-associated family protein
MFAKTIIDSDAFLDMPATTQLLYFHLSMRADDDGFINNPKKIQRIVGCSDDDLKLLLAKSFLLAFESGVVVIKHWKIHNYIRGDRKKETVYPEEMALLDVKDNGAYTFKAMQEMLPDGECTNETPRQKAYRESSLPYNFDYKIKRVFYGRECPICNAKMQSENDGGIVTNNRIPSIQHNMPISKGGKHELGNISVICKECNVTLQDTVTGELNAKEVIEEWEKICMTGKCQSSDSQVTGNCHTQVRLGKVRLGKDSIGEDNNNVSENELSTGYDEQLSTVLGKIIKEKWKRTPTENEISLAIQLVGELNGQVSMFADALDIAAQYGARAKNWKYVRSIVDSWVAKGYKTEEDVLMHELNRKGGV